MSYFHFLVGAVIATLRSINIYRNSTRDRQLKQGRNIKVGIINKRIYRFPVNSLIYYQAQDHWARDLVPVEVLVTAGLVED